MIFFNQIWWICSIFLLGGCLIFIMPKIVFSLDILVGIILFKLLNHQEDNLKLWPLIKSDYYIVTNPSTTWWNDASSEYHHFFTLSYHRQTYHDYWKNRQKLGIFLENKAFWNLKMSKKTKFSDFSLKNDYENQKFAMFEEFLII